MVPTLNEILESELGADHGLLFRPQWRFNYSVITTDMAQILAEDLYDIFPAHDRDELSQIFPPKRVHVFSFPVLEKTNVLLGSIVGHEIGHFFHNRWKDTGQFKQYMEHAERQLSTHYKSEERKKKTRNIFEAYEKAQNGVLVVKGMYREILPDIIGYFLFGPAILFALYYITDFEATIDTPRKENRFYPPTKYRIRLIFERLYKRDSDVKGVRDEGSQCSEALKNFEGELESYLETKNDLSALSQVHVERQLFEDTLDDLLEYAKASVSGHYFSHEFIGAMYDKLARSVPINEISGVPMTMCSILFVGWLRFYEINEEHSQENYVKEYQILTRLLLKSVFSSNVHRRFLQRGPS